MTLRSVTQGPNVRSLPEIYGTGSYCFTPKHHGAGPAHAAQWLPSLRRSDEFEVFNMADRHDFSDEHGNLYGLLIKTTSDGRELLVLGTRNEQISRFWNERQADAHWHGHPLYPCIPINKSDEGKINHKPPQEIFVRLVETGLLSQTKATRLRIGKHVGKLGI